MLPRGFVAFYREHIPGDHTGGATPVPIPNTEVKSSRADDTAVARLWESRMLPGSFAESPQMFISVGFSFQHGFCFHMRSRVVPHGAWIL